MKAFETDLMSERTEKSRCNMIYWNLVELLSNKATGQQAAVYLREFWQTKRCDQFSNLSGLRKALRDRMGDEDLSTVFAFKEEQSQERKATQAVAHYYRWHSEELVKALPVQSRVYYHLIYNPTHALFSSAAAVGLGRIVYVRRTSLADWIRNVTRKTK